MVQEMEKETKGLAGEQAWIFNGLIIGMFGNQ
jgi:hypothetical protein